MSWYLTITVYTLNTLFTGVEMPNKIDKRDTEPATPLPSTSRKDSAANITGQSYSKTTLIMFFYYCSNLRNNECKTCSKYIHVKIAISLAHKSQQNITLLENCVLIYKSIILYIIDTQYAPLTMLNLCITITGITLQRDPGLC